MAAARTEGGEPLARPPRRADTSLRGDSMRSSRERRTTFGFGAAKQSQPQQRWRAPGILRKLGSLRVISNLMPNEPVAVTYNFMEISQL